MTRPDTIKCPNCEAAIDTSAAVGGVVKCKYCKQPVILPKIVDGAAAVALETAKTYLNLRDFDGAHEIYRDIADKFPDEPEAYFGMALAEFKIQFIHDKVNNRLQPICHGITQKKFTDDKNYQKALGACGGDGERLAEYRALGNEIDDISRKFGELSADGVYYDTFICVKVTEDDGSGRHTEDSHTADDLYHELVKRGYSPFYSEREVKGRTGADYEALILYALHSARSMLIVCSDENYLRSPWVGNEYARYIELMANDEKRLGSIAVVFKGSPIEKLPGVSGRIQGINSAGGDAFLRVIEFVDKFAASAPTKKAPDLKRKEYSPVTYAKKSALQVNIQKRNLAATGGGKTVSASETAKLGIAEELLRKGDFEHAKKFAEDILQSNAGVSKAYWLMFLSECKAEDRNKWIDSYDTVNSWDNFERAISYAQPSEKKLYYDALKQKVKKTHDIGAFEEYLALPDTSEAECDALTQTMCDYAIERNYFDIFDAAIKYVTDVDMFIHLNFTFADKTNELKYWKAVLSVDEGNKRALAEVFFGEVCGNDFNRIYELCSGPQNFADLEKKLFAYGFNKTAFTVMFRSATVAIGEQKVDLDVWCGFIDFLLSLVPRAENDLYVAACKTAEYYLLLYRKLSYVARYNDRLLDIDKYDYEAHLIACMTENGINDPYSLTKKPDLLDDGNFINAINSYAEKHPTRDNAFIAIPGNRNLTFKSFTEVLKPIYQDRDHAVQSNFEKLGTLSNLIDVMNACEKIKQEQSARDKKKREIEERKAREEIDFRERIAREELERREREENEKREKKKRAVLVAVFASVAAVAFGLAVMFVLINILPFVNGDGELALTTMFMSAAPCISIGVAALYMFVARVRGTSKVVASLFYGLTVGAIVFVSLCLAVIIMFWCTADKWFTFELLPTFSWVRAEDSAAPVTWSSIVMFIGGVIVLGLLIAALAAEHEDVDGYFTLGMDECATVWPSVLLAVISSLLTFSAGIGAEPGGSGLEYLSEMHAELGGMFSALMIFSYVSLGIGVASHGLLCGDNDRVHDVYFILHALLNCVKLGLFVMCIFSVMQFRIA